MVAVAEGAGKVEAASARVEVGKAEVEPAVVAEEVAATVAGAGV